jgi:hypothetical protein
MATRQEQDSYSPSDPSPYHAPLTFVERPARPTAPVARAVVASPPAWLGPPHDVLSGIAPMELIVARTDQTVIAIASIQAYPAGFDFTLSLRLRTVSVREDQQLPHLLAPSSKQTRCLMSSCALVCSSPTVVRLPTSTARLTTRRTKGQIHRC